MSTPPELLAATLEAIAASLRVPDDEPVRREPDAPMLLTLGQVARELGVHKSTVERMHSRGELPVVRIGRNVRVRHRELAAWVDALGGGDCHRKA